VLRSYVAGIEPRSTVPAARIELLVSSWSSTPAARWGAAIERGTIVRYVDYMITARLSARCNYEHHEPRVLTDDSDMSLLKNATAACKTNSDIKVKSISSSF
jgi:hypothetical protein